jgi:hypothetical protein
MEGKAYYAPIPTFLVFVAYLAMGALIVAMAMSSGNDIGMYLSSSVLVSVLALLCFLVERIIRLSYHLKVHENKIYECGLFTKKRMIPIDSITRIRWMKQNFWTGGTVIITTPFSLVQNSEWRRQFYIESPEHTLPKYPVSKSLIKDLIKIRPELKVDEKQLTFDSPFNPNKTV